MKNKTGALIPIIALIFVFIAGCTGFQIKAPSLDQISTTGPKLVGALVAENNPEDVATILKYGEVLLRSNEPISFKAKLDQGIDWLLKKYVEKPAIRVLIIDCLPQIEIEESATPDLPWMDKVKPILEAFIEGVRIGAPAEVSLYPTFPWWFADLYNINAYIDSLMGETLRQY